MGRRTTRRLIPGAVTLALLVGAAPSAVIAGPSSAAADAAQNRNLTALRALLGSKADVNAAQPDGTTALHWAAHWNDAEAVMLLLRAGANPKATPVAIAIANVNNSTFESSWIEFRVNKVPRSRRPSARVVPNGFIALNA